MAVTVPKAIGQTPGLDATNPSPRSPAPTTAFTYQGQLSRLGAPVSDYVSFRFRLFDAAEGGRQIGPVQDAIHLPVVDGRFSVELDFGLEAFGVEPPKYAHIPLILNADGSKMSKRDRGASLTTYLDEGFLPEAVNNYLCLLGWSPKDNTEKLSLAEVVERFDLPQILRHNAKFDFEKLVWLQGEYCRELPNDRFYELGVHAFAKVGVDTNKFDTGYVKAALDTCKGKIKTFNELPAYGGFYFRDEIAYDPEAASNAGTLKIPVADEDMAGLVMGAATCFVIGLPMLLLIEFQWVFFFLIPEFLFQWAVKYQWVGEALANDPKFAGQGWRTYGIVYAWPLFFYTFFYDPHKIWIVWGVLLTFALIPILAFFHGKRYCSWICGCGADRRSSRSSHRIHQLHDRRAARGPESRPAPISAGARVCRSPCRRARTRPTGLRRRRRTGVSAGIGTTGRDPRTKAPTAARRKPRRQAIRRRRERERRSLQDDVPLRRKLPRREEPPPHRPQLVPR